jgi:ArsR family transcriptional regulator
MVIIGDVMSPVISATAPEAPTRTKGCCQPLAPPLPDNAADHLAELFRALADPTRVQMVHMLRAVAEPICVCDFTAAFDLGQPTVSHHLAKLREAGLVTSTRRGIWTFHSLSPNLGAAARAVLDQIP